MCGCKSGSKRQAHSTWLVSLPDGRQLVFSSEEAARAKTESVPGATLKQQQP